MCDIMTFDHLEGMAKYECNHCEHEYNTHTLVKIDIHMSSIPN